MNQPHGRDAFGRTWLYLHIDCDGSVLYVGKTYKPEKREREHRSRSPWWPAVDRVVVCGPYLDNHARRLERHVIELLDPPHNLVHTTRWEYRAGQDAA